VGFQNRFQILTKETTLLDLTKYRVPGNYPIPDTGVKGLALDEIRHRQHDWRRAQATLEAQFADDLAAEYGMVKHPLRYQLYQLAWDRGHAHGLQEVEIVYRNLISDLLDKRPLNVMDVERGIMHLAWPGSERGGSATAFCGKSFGKTAGIIFDQKQAQAAVFCGRCAMAVWTVEKKS
jgi:hypothetical protein